MSAWLGYLSGPEQGCTIAKKGVQIVFNFLLSENLSYLESVTSEASERETVPLCRVVLSDGATAVIQVHSDESIRELIGRVLAKRGLFYQAFEVYLVGNNSGAPIPLDDQASTVANREIRLEQRIVFRLDLPNRKTISVRSKVSKTLGQVLRPVLHKYNYRIDLVTICSMSKNEVLDISMPIIAVDGCRLTVLTRSTEWHQNEHQHNKIHTSKTFTKSVLPDEPTSKPSLDEITNRVFEEVLSVKQQNTYDGSNGATISEDDVSESSSAVVPRFLRRDSAFIDKLKSRARKSNVSTCKNKNIGSIGKSDSEELYEGLKRAQRSRLDDQRGTEINFELPDFLKDKENTPQAMRKIRKLKENDHTHAEDDPIDKTSSSSNVSNVSSYPLNCRRLDEKLPTKLTCKTYETPIASSTIQQSSTFGSENDVHLLGKHVEDKSNEIVTNMMPPPPRKKTVPPPLPPKPKNLSLLLHTGSSPSTCQHSCSAEQDNLMKNSSYLKPSEVKNATRLSRCKKTSYSDDSSTSFV